MLQKAGVQQKAEAGSRVIMCPRCQSPNEPTATLCVKCKSVLRLQDAVSISGVQKKLEEQNKTIEKMQGQIDMMLQGLLEKDKQHFEQKDQFDVSKDQFDVIRQELAKEDPLSIALKRGYFLSKRKAKAK